MTKFSLPPGSRGISCWGQFPAPTSSGSLNGILIDRARLKAFKDQGVKWLSLLWMDDLWQRSYKETTLSDPSHLISLIEQANDYGMRVVLRLAFWKQTREQAFAGTLLRPMDGVIESAARVMARVPLGLNAFSPCHEWGLVGDTFTQTALADATAFIEAQYDAWVPKIRALAPEATIVLCPPGIGKFHTGAHALMRPRPGQNIIRQIEYTTQAAEAKAWYASRGESCIMSEGFQSHVDAALAAGVSAALWKDLL